MNVPWGPYVLDAYWPELGLVLEIDDWETHRSRAAFAADRARDRALTAAGLKAVRITADDLPPRRLGPVLARLGVTSLRHP
jgi:very-short-patch-repair endonuclease